ncbi:FtsX-like permease family protein [Kineosporia sp. NBRC 101731]|uniref:FtsX-like permease family protein n=1 Tax=Kineosporia sp. NBRC 101731 TaxID=3032199 RepID=UPI0024A11DC7|nr:FtsX-like permease family protein [Kineosporia sp. NBRC 101731]GLY29965.1 hypothetical protein Kisp02_33300 [Kineosporia sp. NBRC 101731]
MSLHRPSIRGRARADRGPLLLTALVVLVAVLLTAAVPPLIDRRADRAVTEAVGDAGDAANMIAQVPFEAEIPGYPRVRRPNSATVADGYAGSAQQLLDPTLRSVFGPPVVSVSSSDLELKTGDRPGRTLRLVYVGEPAPLTWIDGSPPAQDSSRGEERAGPAPWPVSVGLSEAASEVLDLGTGDRVRTEDREGGRVELRISGIYRAQNPSDQVWKAQPQLLEPVVFTDTRGITTSFTSVLLSADSLPDGRLATAPTDMGVTIEFMPTAGSITRDNAPTVIDSLVELGAGSGVAQDDGPAIDFNTRLSGVLERVLDQISVATALAMVLLGAVLVAVGLALLLTADLLTRRRGGVLTGLRRRGASLPGLWAELAVESLFLTLLAGGTGLLLVRWSVGAVSLTWPLPVLVVAALGAPTVGVVTAARATTGRAAPANRSARRTLAVTRQLRRLTAEAAVLLATVGAVIALSQRGIVTQDGAGGAAASLFPALAPTLVAVTGGILLLRVLPPVLEGLLRASERFRGSLPLLAASRARATAGRALPLVLIVTSVSLGVFALSVRATASPTTSAAARLPADARPLAGALADGLRDLALVTGVLLFVLAVVALVVGALGGARERGETAARLRTLGLTGADTRWICLGELLPVALVGGLVGWVLGRVLASRAIGLLSLRVLNDLPADPPLVVPVITYAPVVLLIVTVVLVAAVESSLRRRERLGQVLRA